MFLAGRDIPPSVNTASSKKRHSRVLGEKTMILLPVENPEFRRKQAMLSTSVERSGQVICFQLHPSFF